MKTFIKRRLFPGDKRPRVIRGGLAKGLTFLIDPATKTQRLLGLDEQELSGALRKALANASTFLDIGASDGYYTVIAAARNRSLRAIACEPSAALEADFRENLRLNGLDQDERIRWREEFVGSGGTTLDELAAGCEMPLVIKIDVEGGERDVLESGPRALARPATLLVETHSQDLERECLALLEAAGFACQIIRPAWWRRLLPEARPSEHNRWIVAAKGQG